MYLPTSDTPRQMYFTSTISNSSSPVQERHARAVNDDGGHIYDSEGPLNLEALTDTHLQDVGLYPEAYYNARLPYLVSCLRKLLLPLLTWELPILEKIQHFHTHWLTLYFLITANLGSHTFYVIMLPLSAWLGSLHFTRDLIIVLGVGIYLTGAVKDLLCLPRPHSPPLERLTLSHYTAKEYGCPSSHSANATSVCILLFLHVHNNSLLQAASKNAIYVGLSVYWLSMILGRLYCGMHGLVDVTVGVFIGAITVLLRLATKSYWDYMILSNDDSVLTDFLPIILIGFYYSLIYFHPTPIEPCPCFEDSVAFIAVLLGLDLTYCSIKPLHSAESQSMSLMELYQTHPARIYYNWEEMGFSLTCLRMLIGVFFVVLWKSLSKPLFTYLIKKIRKEPPVRKGISELCFAFIPKTDTKIFVKFIVYSGIPMVAIYSMHLFRILGI